jgi:Holliday junction DNA helicase RuvA
VIVFVDGIVAELRDASVVVQTGSFGLEVFAPKATLMGCSKGAAIRLYTHLISKDDQLALYGFHSEDLYTLFTFLITISGVGPKLALAVLSSMPATLVASAILNEDAGLLSSAPGVGKRTAERIIVELKNKLPEHLMAASGGAKPKSVLSAAGDDAVEALLALGYRETKVKSVVADLSLKESDATAETLIRKALSKLS